MSDDQYQNVCRLCLGHNKVQLRSLRDPVLTRKIKECTSLKLQENDSLPQNICNNCLKIVEFIYQFRKQCLKADEILHSCIYGCNVLDLHNLLEHQGDFKDEYQIKSEIDDNISICSGINDRFNESDNEDIVDKTKSIQSINKLSNYKVKKYKERKTKEIRRKENINKEEFKRSRIKCRETKGSELYLNRKLSSKTNKGLRKVKNKLATRFQCDHCGKTFRKKQQFQNHVRIHTGEKPFACEFCPKIFRLQHQQQTHSRTHTKERPYACKFCGTRFVDQSNRNQHQNIHTNDRKFPCPHCDKRFMRKFDMNKHIARHTGGKMYECSICTKSYADASSLTKHKKTHIVDLKEEQK